MAQQNVAMYPNPNPGPVVTAQPGQVYVVQGQPAPATQVPREWSSGLFSCFDDCGGCLYGYFCAPCLACSVSSRLEEHSCAPICVGGGLLALRAKLRAMYGIRGGICMDGCCILTFCGPCALCQMDRELKAMGKN